MRFARHRRHMREMIAELNRERQSVSVVPPFRPLLALTLLLMTAHRLPAPISEESTPTPKPKQESTPRPKPKTEAAPKPKAASKLSFTGTWSGTTINQSSDGSSGAASYIVKISDDEKAVLVNVGEVGKTVGGPPSPASCTRFGEALTWSFSSAGGTTTYTMRLNSNGTASFLREGQYTGGDYDGITYSQRARSRKTVRSLRPMQQVLQPRKLSPNQLPKLERAACPSLKRCRINRAMFTIRSIRLQKYL